MNALESLGFGDLATFVGRFTHNLDTKKRLTIPSEWRERVEDPQLFCLPGINTKCLYVLPKQEMVKKLSKLSEVSLTDGRAQQFARQFLSRAVSAPWDSQGRIRVGDELLEMAGLKKEVVLVGVGTRFELWSPDDWAAQEAAAEAEAASFSESAKFIGF